MEYKPIYPKSRYKGKEKDLQKIIFTEFSKHPDIFAFHVKNEGISGKAGKWYGASKAKEGVVSGIPDILIINSSINLIDVTMNIYLGMAIELKANCNKPDENQLNCLKKFEERGWYTCVCWSFDDFEYHFNQYFGK